MQNIDLHQRCQDYLQRSLGTNLRILHAEPLTQSSRLAPWRLDAEVEGEKRSYVLRLGGEGCHHEYEFLRAMQSLPIPTPRVYDWDAEGTALGVPCLLSDYIFGDSLLAPVLAGEAWAEDLYLDAVCQLQSITLEQLAPVADLLADCQSAADVLEYANEYFQENSHPIAEKAYARLRATMPKLPELCFSNGDLWLDNFLVRDRQLAGIIDFENAGFSDPLFEFLLSFFIRPELKQRGLIERYCQRMHLDPGALPWYHGLEYFDTLHWVLKLGKPFEQYSAQVLEAALEEWLRATG
ncbi:MAG: phosphotransferase [Chloroflexota bacterium]